MMQEKILFQEKQRFTQWWIWVINIGILLLSFRGIYIQIIKGKAFGNNPASDKMLVFITLLMVLFCLFFFFLNLKTRITKDKIYFRFFLFHLKERKYLISDIQKMEVVKYSPIGDYGGWGIRGFRDDKAFNVKGNKGLKILFKDGTKRLIGTQKPEELEKIIQKLKF